MEEQIARREALHGHAGYLPFDGTHHLVERRQSDGRRVVHQQLPSLPHRMGGHSCLHFQCTGVRSGPAGSLRERGDHRRETAGGAITRTRQSRSTITRHDTVSGLASRMAALLPRQPGHDSTRDGAVQPLVFVCVLRGDVCFQKEPGTGIGLNLEVDAQHRRLQ